MHPNCSVPWPHSLCAKLLERLRSRPASFRTERQTACLSRRANVSRSRATSRSDFFHTSTPNPSLPGGEAGNRDGDLPPCNANLSHRVCNHDRQRSMRVRIDPYERRPSELRSRSSRRSQALTMLRPKAMVCTWGTLTCWREIRLPAHSCESAQRPIILEPSLCSL